MPPAVAMTDFGIGLDRVLERAPLVAAIGVLPVEPEDLADGAAGELLDLAAELDERKVEILRQHAPERRFARAAQADQRDLRRSGRRLLAARRPAADNL